MYIISNKTIVNDNKINRRYDIFSNVVYAHINKGVIFDKSHITLLLINEFISDRFYDNEKKKKENEFKTYLLGN